MASLGKNLYSRIQVDTTLLGEVEEDPQSLGGTMKTAEEWVQEMRRSADVMREAGYDEVAAGNEELATYIETLEQQLHEAERKTVKENQKYKDWHDTWIVAGQPNVDKLITRYDEMKQEVRELLGIFSDYDFKCPDVETARKIWNSLHGDSADLRKRVLFLMQRKIDSELDSCTSHGRSSAQCVKVLIEQISNLTLRGYTT